MTCTQEKLKQMQMQLDVINSKLTDCKCTTNMAACHLHLRLFPGLRAYWGYTFHIKVCWL